MDGTGHWSKEDISWALYKLSAERLLDDLRREMNWSEEQRAKELQEVRASYDSKTRRSVELVAVVKGAKR